MIVTSIANKFLSMIEFRRSNSDHYHQSLAIKLNEAYLSILLFSQVIKVYVCKLSFSLK